MPRGLALRNRDRDSAVVVTFHRQCPRDAAQPRAARDGFFDLALRFARIGWSALLGSPPVLRTALVVLSTPLSASLTACSVGNASVTSGSISTIFVPSRARRTYFPRIPPFIDEKSYSGRRSSDA